MKYFHGTFRQLPNDNLTEPYSGDILRVYEYETMYPVLLAAFQQQVTKVTIRNRLGLIKCVLTIQQLVKFTVAPMRRPTRIIRGMKQGMSTSTGAVVSLWTVPPDWLTEPPRDPNLVDVTTFFADLHACRNKEWMTTDLFQDTWERALLSLFKDHEPSGSRYARPYLWNIASILGRISVDAIRVWYQHPAERLCVGTDVRTYCTDSDTDKLRLLRSFVDSLNGDRRDQPGTGP